MASLTQWTWVWVNSGSWWWTGRAGLLQSMGSQRVGHSWATELNWNVSRHCQISLGVGCTVTPGWETAGPKTWEQDWPSVSTETEFPVTHPFPVVTHTHTHFPFCERLWFKSLWGRLFPKGKGWAHCLPWVSAFWEVTHFASRMPKLRRVCVRASDAFIFNWFGRVGSSLWREGDLSCWLQGLSLQPVGSSSLTRDHTWGPLHWEWGVLATGSGLGKSWVRFFVF